MAFQFPETSPQDADESSYLRAKAALAFESPELVGLYRAAAPGYPGNFSRDSLIAARLGDDTSAALHQVAYSSRQQGRVRNAQTGEEPGKIHHELPAIDVGKNGRSTAYNACDTTALYLDTVATLATHHDMGLLDTYEPNIVRATKYVLRHLSDTLLFQDDPAFSGAGKYSLKVTYWKDSILNTPDRVEPIYPVVYTQAHFLNAEAVARIGRLINNDRVVQVADDMYAEGFEQLWSGDHFVTGVDQKGVIDPPSSDSLMSLLHIPRAVLPVGYARRIEEYMAQLETAAGYRTGIPVVEGRDNYHTEKVWTHEQALLHMAAEIHNLDKASAVARRILGFIRPQDQLFPELVDADTLTPDGNGLQLWAVEAWKYFRSNEADAAVSV